MARVWPWQTDCNWQLQQSVDWCSSSGVKLARALFKGGTILAWQSHPSFSNSYKAVQNFPVRERFEHKLVAVTLTTISSSFLHFLISPFPISHLCVPTFISTRFARNYRIYVRYVCWPYGLTVWPHKVRPNLKIAPVIDNRAIHTYVCL